jgi:hypothetical protein
MNNNITVEQSYQTQVKLQLKPVRLTTLYSLSLIKLVLVIYCSLILAIQFNLEDDPKTFYLYLSILNYYLVIAYLIVI